MTRRTLSLLLAVTALAALSTAGAAQSANAEYERRAREVALECAQRHLDLGLKLRDQGLVEPSRTEILLAVEVSGGAHRHASEVAGLMRTYGDRFWKKRVRPTASRLAGYEKKAAKVRHENREEQFELAEWADGEGLADEAHAAFLALLDPQAPLVLDKKGRVELDVGKVPAAASERILAAAVRLNGEPFLRDRVLARLPEVEEVYQETSPRLRVRSLRDRGEAAAYHALGEALLPHLEEELGELPDRRLDLFLFSERTVYESYLAAAGLSAYAVVSGVLDAATGTTLVCSEDKSLLEVQGLVLHELTHLAEHGLARAAMPAWYREGLADTFGGQGTFFWDGERLDVGGVMAASRLDPLRRPGGPWRLQDLARIDPLGLWASDPGAAQRFYAQSWALYRYLRRRAEPRLRGRFKRWVADSRDPRTGERGVESPRDAFLRLFGDDWDALEEGFRAWLEEL